MRSLLRSTCGAVRCGRSGGLLVEPASGQFAFPRDFADGFGYRGVGAVDTGINVVRAALAGEGKRHGRATDDMDMGADPAAPESPGKVVTQLDKGFAVKGAMHASRHPGHRGPSDPAARRGG